MGKWDAFAESTANAFYPVQIAKNKKTAEVNRQDFLVLHRRFELRTPWLKVKCSTGWATGAFWIVPYYISIKRRVCQGIFQKKKRVLKKTWKNGIGKRSGHFFCGELFLFLDFFRVTVYHRKWKDGLTPRGVLAACRVSVFFSFSVGGFRTTIFC